MLSMVNKILNLVIKKHTYFLRQSIGPCVRTWKALVGLHVPKQPGRAASPDGHRAQGRLSLVPQPCAQPRPR